jgi:glycine/D-amino acid oxidase-like deaminating enzyme/nitrite reductase/ring-hydroxylating ferredoxin subunit
VDVAVIGGGNTGITTAYLLKQAGLTVALLDRDSFAAANTGHTTAHLTYVTDLRLTELVHRFGRQAAVMAWEMGRAAIDFIEATVAGQRIACEFRRVAGYLHAPPGSRASPDSFRAEAKLATELGFPATFIDEAPLFGTPAIRFDGVAKFHPRRYLRSLLAAIPGEGSHVFEGTEAAEITARPLAVKAAGHTVSCGHVVIATHVPLMGKTNLASAILLQSKLALYTSYAVGARIPRGLAPEALFWDTADPYHYLRVDAHDDHDYAIFGGGDHKTGQAARTPDRFHEVEQALHRAIPEAHVECHWSGQIVETSDGLPFVGETSERQLVATGFAGNGMTFGTASAMIIRDTVLGKKGPWAEVLKVGRTTLKGGAWAYLKENLDYPYYLVRDRLRKADGDAVIDVLPGEAKILKLDGKRVAAYRDEEGRLEAVSAVCTHMGCIVHWNEAERTWDCPCHGSRFKPNGEVIAGPAEDPLAPFRPESPSAR